MGSACWGGALLALGCARGSGAREGVNLLAGAFSLLPRVPVLLCTSDLGVKSGSFLKILDELITTPFAENEFAFLLEFHCNLDNGLLHGFDLGKANRPHGLKIILDHVSSS